MRRLLLVALAALVFPSAAFAHATLKSTTPSFRKELRQGPAVIRLHFDQQVKVLPGSVRGGGVAVVTCAAATSWKKSIAERAAAIFRTFIGKTPLLPRKRFGLIQF